MRTPAFRRRTPLPSGETGRTLLLPILAAALGPALPGTGAPAQEVEACEGPVGTLAVVEPQREALRALSRYDLESPTSLIRMMVQESNCFIVVERGRALERMAQERELARSGELVGGSNVGSGQMQAADFYLTPDVLFSEGNAGALGGAVGGLLGRGAGAVAGGLKFKEAETSLLVTNTRSGVQVASADGSARETDFGGGVLGFLGGGGAALGGYTNTNEGKVIAASFLDNYNEIVRTVRGDPNLPPLSPEEVQARITGETPAGGGFSAGDVVVAKIDNVQVLSEPASGAAVVATVGPSDPMVFLGQKENGYLQVQSSEGPGWVLEVLVTGQ